MLRHSLRVRLLLPVLALGLIVMSGLTVILAVTEARRIESETEASIRRTSILSQTMFSLTREMLLDRVDVSMRNLRKQVDELGPASQGNQVRVGRRTANDILLGQKSQANTFGLVDAATSSLVDDGASISKQGNATIFSRAGDDFVRISTNITNADGNRAVGTVLDPNSKAAGKLRNGESFYGVLDVLGNPYVTRYEPIFADNDKRVIGALAIAYKADTPELATVIGSRSMLSSGFVAVLDSKNKLRFQSTTGSTTDSATIERIVKESPEDWVVVKEEIRNWGFTLASAYPKSDINTLILHQSLWIAGIGLLVCALMVGVQSALIWNRVLRPVQNLTAVAEELSMGKWNHTIAEVNLKDEIGTLARAISRLSNSVRLAMERLSKR
ncbi:Cache 3/Cache 2 fusion domain-containing protein [Xanthomonas prunicola]|uniref:Cache 3/Cache 2 fusion domain-containing protein n=1 Tax=Xanthomonas prunicola TaxID=2053930 RepID=A0A9Q9J7L1_9XANT|nr:Cache 3/Cache 2 fusion domain-containing protein [Xanthomonas prunicola]USJ02934.1 Cache 3/Cache 2 fusion domain-containing protein [Xanthomonas prunicola]UXA51262.1 Cache 3/Cache 2 fusion domain-containing protein [Xanthomonas prunicola]UXA55162.1 Cache 3/Cache 2 fusion domain-containing protein [Xanthomonas prunicola]UXA59500.1 Cache 3/Cache 2 fusion domain-containing protein [Xanthomonas prunicola]UXA63446.1 Cache 3/Cache 2 fusion domain-containing protein [Xanthomonas prunicola]